MMFAQTIVELPKYGASSRDAPISVASVPTPARKTTIPSRRDERTTKVLPCPRVKRKRRRRRDDGVVSLLDETRPRTLAVHGQAERHPLGRARRRVWPLCGEPARGGGTILQPRAVAPDQFNKTKHGTPRLPVDGAGRLAGAERLAVSGMLL